MVALSIQDWFMAGLGFDLVGALLLALGLVPRARTISVSTAARGEGQYDPPEMLRQTTERRDALFGLFALGVGFSVQALGYFLGLYLGTAPAAGTEQQAWTSLVFFAGTAGLMGALYWGLRARILKFLLRRLAHFNPLTGEKRDRPYSSLLEDFGNRLGEQSFYSIAARNLGEQHKEYARQVWGVREVVLGGPRDREYEAENPDGELELFRVPRPQGGQALGETV